LRRNGSPDILAQNIAVNLSRRRSFMLNRWIRSGGMLALIPICSTMLHAGTLMAGADPGNAVATFQAQPLAPLQTSLLTGLRHR